MTRTPTRTKGLARRLPIASAGACLIAACLALGSGAAFAVGARSLTVGTPSRATGVSPSAPPASAYSALPVCRAPAPRHAGCLALALAPRATAATQPRPRPQGLARGRAVAMATSATTCAQIYPACLTPTALGEAYFPGEAPQAPASEPQTIALVDAYDDPNAENDLTVYNSEFGLPSCTAVNGCFTKLNQLGETGHPPVAKNEAEKEEAEGWALEISTDVQAAHAVCQNCHIVLVEANSSSYSDLLAAENTAAGVAGADEISNSWGGSEAELTESELASFERPGLVITASAGDDGYLNWDRWESEPLQFDEPDFPASSPHVVAVGGTKLTLSGGAWQTERVWNNDQGGTPEGAAGGGCSLRFPAPSWQRGVADWPAVGCEGRRAVADIAADADPTSGVAVYDSVPYPYEEKGKKKTAVLKWVPIGGTSLASPIVAAMFALAGGAHGVADPARTLYSHLGSPLLHDVTTGGNGQCDASYTTCSGSMKPLSPFDCGEGALICNAATGYDGPTGVGTPAGVGAFTISGESPGTGNPESKGGGGEETGGGTGKTSGEGEAAGSSGGPSGPAPGSGSTEPTTGGEGSGATQPPSPTTDFAPTPQPAPTTIHLSGLALTPRALAAARRGRTELAQIAFAFTLSASASVRVVVARALRVRGHLRWVSVPGAFTLARAGAGRNRGRLRGRATLAASVYRLTLTAAHGASLSRTFLVG